MKFRIATLLAVGLMACSLFAAPRRGTVKTIAQPIQGGTVTGAGTYRVGQVISLVATANPNWHFVVWNDGTTNRSFTFVVPHGTTTFTASFETNVVYGNLALAAEPINGGTVAGAGSYPVGKAVDISAKAFTNWSFTRWQDNDTSNPRTVIVPNGTLYMVATFMTNPPVVPPITGSAALDWPAVSGAAKYVASWGIVPGTYTNSVMSDATTVRIQGLITNQLYFFAVQSMAADGRYSPYSCEVSCRIGQTNACTVGL